MRKLDTDSSLNQTLDIAYMKVSLFMLLARLTFILIYKGRHQKKTVERVKTALLGGRGSEKLLNFHHLQMMKNMEGEGSQSNISLLHRTQLLLI